MQSLSVEQSNTHFSYKRILSNSDDVRSKILVVEDNLLNQKVARLFLEGLGYSVEIAENGTKALTLARTQEYALILMDVDLPDIQGTEVTRRIRATYDSVPIIGCTANSHQHYNECFESGMDDLLPKPIIISELKNLRKRAANYI